jgi:malonyl-CoA/methylmalonyl-CoA synthetase
MGTALGLHDGESRLVERLRQLAKHDRVAVEDDRGTTSFRDLWERALRTRDVLCEGAGSIAGRRVLVLMPPGASWLEAFLGILLGGGVALPLSPLYPELELQWFAADAEADTLVIAEELEAGRGSALREGRRVILVGASELAGGAPVDVEPGPRAGDVALLLYTSGTTGKPKGAMITHENLAIQADLLREAWGWSPADTLLHALPLHHLHGLGISLLTSLLAGGTTRMLPRFDAARVWEELGRGCTAWMGVPTMYQKMFEALDAADEATRARWSSAARGLRLATSGSAALPVTIAERWRELTGAIPLERFGMTEIGVGMTNPLAPEGRRAGHVGRPLPTVDVRLVDEEGAETEAGPGEAWIRGPSVFAGYWRRDEATRAAFTDGWFRTGDVATRSPEGVLRLLGRTSVDILKSGGYKLSALEIEEALREHPAIAEVCVIGVPDATWGDRVVAVVVPRDGRAAECGVDALRAWAKERIAPYKIPRQVIVVDALPRNAVGKVVKPDLIRAAAAGTLGR